MKVIVYAIAKNEQKFADSFMGSAAEADQVVVLDTGSSDHTVEKLRKLGACVYECSLPVFRFDEARNEALRHVPEDVDVCVSADLDEVIRPGWRKALEAAWAPKTTRGFYIFNWNFNGDGTPMLQYLQTRIHARHGHAWRYATHEVVEYIGKGKEVLTFLPGVVFDHHPDNSKPRNFYTDLLELDVRENPKEPRCYYYLGREYCAAGQYQECVATLAKFLSLPKSYQQEERRNARQFIARSLAHLGNMEAATSQCYSAIAEAPDTREPYMEMAFIASLAKDWETVRYFCIKALSIEKQPTGYLGDPNAWSDLPHELLAAACGNLGRIMEGYSHAKRAAEMNPAEPRTIGNLEWYEHALKVGV